MVDEAGQVATLGGVNDVLAVNPEEVGATNAHRLVVLLPHVGHGVADHLPHVLDHHLLGRDRLQRKQPPVVNTRFGEFQVLLSELCEETGGQFLTHVFKSL